MFVKTNTVFSNSYSSQSGGSIYVSSGSCVQYRVCSIHSAIDNETDIGCHSFVSTQQKNNIIDCSISKSHGNMNCIHLSGGDQLINSTNITQTICKGNAAYTCWGYPKSHRISYSTIYNNTADDNNIMYHYDKNQYIARCNVIQNTHNKLGDYDWGIVYSGCQLLDVSYCIFKSNSGSILFNNFNNKLFNVDQCYIETKNIGALSNNAVNMKETNSFVQHLIHLSTHECVTEIVIIDEEPTSSPKSERMLVLSSLFLSYHCAI